MMTFRDFTKGIRNSTPKLSKHQRASDAGNCKGKDRRTVAHLQQVIARLVVLANRLSAGAR
jgi:hypothetical protein